MPIYPFKCPTCGLEREIRVNGLDYVELWCPDCGVKMEYQFKSYAFTIDLS